MSDRYHLSPAWHVMDAEGGEYGHPREMAAATSSADGERIVAALNESEGIRETLRDLWGDIRQVDEHFVPDELASRVRASLDS